MLHAHKLHFECPCIDFSNGEILDMKLFFSIQKYIVQYTVPDHEETVYELL